MPHNEIDDDEIQPVPEPQTGHNKFDLCLLRDLPPEILGHIFQQLQPQDLLRLRLVDRHLHLTIHSFENAILYNFLSTFRHKHPKLDLPSTLGQPQRGLVCLVELQRQLRAAEELASVLADRVVSKLNHRNTDAVPECKETWLKKKHDLLQQELYPSLFLLGQFFRLFRDVVVSGDAAFSSFSDHEYLELIDIYYLDQQYIMEMFQNADANTFIDATYAWWVLKGVCTAYGLTMSPSVSKFPASLYKILLFRGMTGMRDILRIGPDREAQLNALRQLEITMDCWSSKEPVQFSRASSDKPGTSDIYTLVWKSETPPGSVTTNSYGFPRASEAKKLSRRWGVQSRFLNNQHIWDMSVIAVLQRRFGTTCPDLDVSTWLAMVLLVPGDRTLLSGRWCRPDRTT